MADENQPRDTENFNMAIATLKRLDYLLQWSSQASIQGDFIKLYGVLRELRRNIACFNTPTQQKEIDDLFAKLPANWICSGRVVRPLLKGKVAEVLDLVAMKIQFLMKEHGLLMPKADDPRFALQG